MEGWLTVIAIAGFLLALGRFLDKYHIRLRTKDSVRSLLIRGFVALDSTSIPDLPRRILTVVLRPDKSLGVRYAIILFVLNLIVALSMLYNLELWLRFAGRSMFEALEVLLTSTRYTGNLFGGNGIITEFDFITALIVAPFVFLVCPIVPILLVSRFVSNPQGHRLSIFAHFAPLLIIPLMTMYLFCLSSLYATVEGTWYEGVITRGLYVGFSLLPIPVFTIMRYTFGQLYDSKASSMKYLSALITVAYALLIITTSLLFMLIFLGGLGYGEDAAVVMFFIFLSPVVIVASIILGIICCKLFIDLTRKVTLLVFEAASAPDVSPFSYAAALLGVLVVAVKLLVGASVE